jgi:hypothetical protein
MSSATEGGGLAAGAVLAAGPLDCATAGPSPGTRGAAAGTLAARAVETVCADNPKANRTGANARTDKIRREYMRRFCGSINLNIGAIKPEL